MAVRVSLACGRGVERWGVALEGSATGWVDDAEAVLVWFGAGDASGVGCG